MAPGLVALWVAFCRLASYFFTAEPSSVELVHIVFSNHLDIGFAETDDVVINMYFDNYFPKAIAVAKELRLRGGPERLKWMTHAYLVSLFVDCPAGMGLHCPNSTAVEAFGEAVQRGDIYWHAFPFNAELELFDEDLLTFNIKLVHDLDAKYNVTPKITLSLRDVPGMTRAALPLLAKQGVKAISVGVNGGSAPPDVPQNQAFIWRDLASGTEALAMWHPGGYSGTPVDSAEECITPAGYPEALCCSFKQDNSGPPDVQEVLDIYAVVQKGFPDSKLIASTFDAFTAPLLEALPSLPPLPVVTGEVGDTWVYGVQSDADKIALFRELSRARHRLAETLPEATFYNFSRLISKIPEHTWGLDIGNFLPDFENWSNKAFHALLAADNPRYRKAEYAWIRQREYLIWALQSLGDSAEGLTMVNALSVYQKMKEVPTPAAAGFRQVPLLELRNLTSHAWSIEIDPNTGGLSSLRRLWPGREGGNWASLERPMGEVVYSTYVESSFDTVWSEYEYYIPSQLWFEIDLGKPNCSNANPRRADQSIQLLEDAWVKLEGTGFHVLLKAVLPEWMVTDAGAPREVWLEISSSSKDDKLHYDVLWVDKTATRLPEAMWVKFAPPAAAADPATWQMSKLGSLVSPLDVVVNGSQAMHAVGDAGVSVSGAAANSWERLQISTLDVSLVSPGEPTALPSVRNKPDMTKGMSFNLANNLWDTNYVLWQPYSPEASNMRFRFILEMHDDSKTAVA